MIPSSVSTPSVPVASVPSSAQPDFASLYQEVILEHYKKPRNFRVVENASHYALGKNPLCGDQFAVYFTVDDTGHIIDVGFQGDGCAISKASASMMTVAVKGKSLEEALVLKQAFHTLLTLDPSQIDAETQLAQARITLGRLKFLETVKEYPVRVKCATLAWHALEAAVQQTQQVTTES
ncbi:MAG: Fe-S cluster assembly sulfur transfer protein SufU [Vampirovibrionales bacterium]